MKPTYQSLFAFALVALTGCGIQRPSTSERQPTERVVSTGQASLQERLDERLTSTPSYAPTLRGNLQAELRLGKEQVSTKIHATIQRGQMIYWSVVPFPLIEAARIWFTPTGITAVDRIHGRYAELSYAELSEELGYPLSYPEVEQLLLGKPFIPQGARGLRGGGYSVTTATDQSAQVEAKLDVQRGAASGSYLLSWMLSPNLDPTSFVVQKQASPEKPVFSLRYRHSDASSALAIAEETALYLGTSSSDLPALRLNWSKLRPYTGTLPDLTPKVKESYQRITLNQLLKLLPSQ